MKRLLVVGMESHHFGIMSIYGIKNASVGVEIAQSNNTQSQSLVIKSQLVKMHHWERERKAKHVWINSRLETCINNAWILKTPYSWWTKCANMDIGTWNFISQRCDDVLPQSIPSWENKLLLKIPNGKGSTEIISFTHFFTPMYLYDRYMLWEK